MTPILHLARGTISMCVHAALEEADMAHELRWIEFERGDQTSDAYLAVNPKGRVPALVTEQGTLTEAAAILDWIAATVHPALMPIDDWQAARAREAILYLATTAHPNHAHKQRAHRWADDPAAQDAMRAKVTENMAASAAHLEARLTGAWVVNDFSAADLYLWNVTRWLPGDGVALEDYPRLHAHHARVAARPAVAKVIALHT